MDSPKYEEFEGISEMKGPLRLNAEELAEWKATTWQEYAAETRHGRRVQLQCSPAGAMRVMIGGKEYWRGSDNGKAVRAFEEAR